MKKAILILSIITLCSCGSKNKKSTEAPVDEAAFTNGEAINGEAQKPTKKMKYLYFSAGDAIGFFDNGTVAEYMSCGEN